MLERAKESNLPGLSLYKFSSSQKKASSKVDIYSLLNLDRKTNNQALNPDLDLTNNINDTNLYEIPENNFNNEYPENENQDLELDNKNEVLSQINNAKYELNNAVCIIEEACKNIIWNSQNSSVDKLCIPVPKEKMIGSLVYHLEKVGSGDIATGIINFSSQLKDLPDWINITLPNKITLEKGAVYRLWFESTELNQSNQSYQYIPVDQNKLTVWLQSMGISPGSLAI